jgi:hypothetical protein
VRKIDGQRGLVSTNNDSVERCMGEGENNSIQLIRRMYYSGGLYIHSIIYLLWQAYERY